MPEKIAVMPVYIATDVISTATVSPMTACGWLSTSRSWLPGSGYQGAASPGEEA